MANWSYLPRDLLLLIAKYLETYFDVLNFRSVCSNWRVSVPFNFRPRTFRSPFQFHTDKFGSKYFLWQRSVCLFEFLPDHNQTTRRFWLVTLEEDEFGRKHIIDPLYWGKRVPIQYPVVLGMSQFHVQELGRQYNQVFDTADTISTDLVAYMNVNDDDFILMGKYHDPGFINFFKFGDQEWTIVAAEGFTFCVDCIQFEHRFYVADNSGNTFCVEPSSRASFRVGKDLALRCGYKVLIQLGENLLFAELICVTTPPTPTFRFEVFQLDGERKRWDRLESLGEGILFLGEYCKFSAPSIPGLKGNCIVFTQVTGAVRDENGRVVPEELVFDMSSGMTVTLHHRPDLLQLFCPPSFL